MRMVLAVDPGLFTGWALFREVRGQLRTPEKTGTLKGRVNRHRSWDQAVVLLGAEFGKLLRRYQPDDCLVEWPFIAPGTVAKGEDVLKLMFLVGWYGATCQQRDVRFHKIPVRSWKGQLSKERTHDRIKRLCKTLGEPLETEADGHAVDAVGLGLWWLGANFGAGSSSTIRNKVRPEVLT